MHEWYLTDYVFTQILTTPSAVNVANSIWNSSKKTRNIWKAISEFPKKIGIKFSTNEPDCREYCALIGWKQTIIIFPRLSKVSEHFPIVSLRSNEREKFHPHFGISGLFGPVSTGRKPISQFFTVYAPV